MTPVKKIVGEWIECSDCGQTYVWVFSTHDQIEKNIGECTCDPFLLPACHSPHLIHHKTILDDGFVTVIQEKELP
jgi:hypothetical protein